MCTAGVWMALAACAIAAASATAAPAGGPTRASPPAATLDELRVTGERPGPALWHVSRDGHDLWILATLEPLPKNLSWRSEAVDARIGVSQVVLAPPRIGTDIGFFRGMTLLPSLLRARHSPDGQTLEQTLPHELYMRWLALSVRYLNGSAGDERLRPMLAALDLYTHALAAAGLTSDDTVWSGVERTARRHHVPVEPVTLTLKIGDPKGAIRELADIPRSAEIGCLRTTIERLETDLVPMQQRANMWALGDLDGLRAARYPDERIACLDALFSVAELREQFLAARQQVLDTWVRAAQDALAAHASSFAVLPIVEVLRPDGPLGTLRARGYTVQEP